MDQMNRTDGLTTTDEQFSDFRTEPKNGIETFKDGVADKLHAAAGIIHEKAVQNQNSTTAAYASQAANWLDDAAGYVKEVDPQKLKSDLQNQVRRNPGRSLLVAGAAGLLLGFLVRR